MAKVLVAAIAFVAAALGVTGFALTRDGTETANRGVLRPAALVAASAARSPQAPSFGAAERGPLVVGAGVSERARLADALDAFSDAGLPLPALEIVFSDDERACHGHPGSFDRKLDPWRISICSDLDFVILHELAHAWAAAELDETERAGYLAFRGLHTWDDHTVPWGERGTEDAAFIVQQNLMPRRAVPTGPAWDERIAAYEHLTGRPSPLDPTAQRPGPVSQPPTGGPPWPAPHP